LEDIILLDKLRAKLKHVSDLENILTRLSLGRANPKDLLNLKRSLELIVDSLELIKKEGSSKLNNLLKI
jgi:DNA mismatch repair protein MutS